MLLPLLLNNLLSEGGAAPLDEYAGFPSRDFYTPYWMGTMPAQEVRRVAAEQARRVRQAYGIIPKDVEDVVLPLAARQIRASGDEVGQLRELAEALESRSIAFEDYYGGYLTQLRQELKDARNAQSRARRARARATAAEQRKMEAAARRVIAERERLDALRRKQQNYIAMALILSAA